jgi:uncharacterized protein YkwD
VPAPRRRSPVLLVLAFALVCALPLGVAALAGVVSGAALVLDQTETADSPRELASTGHEGDGADGSTATEGDGPTSAGGGVGDDAAPPGTGTADIPPQSGAAPSTTTAPASPTPAVTAPPTTGTSPPATPTPTAAPRPPTRVDQVLALVNAARAAGPGHCGPIQLDPRLTAAAQGHSDDMAARNYFSHDTPDGLDFSARIANAGYPGFASAENIAKGQRSAQQVMTDWMNSPGHRVNIENCEHTAIGIGVNTTAWTWTQDFGI